VLGLPGAALDAQALSWPGFDVPADHAPTLDPAAKARAVAGRADVLKALVTYDQAEADLRGEVARQAPSISLGPGYTWERGLVKLPFALNLGLPSFDLNHAAIAAAEARRAQSGAAIESALANAQGAIEQALAERNAAWAALDRIRRTELPQTQAVAARADGQLARGSIGRVDWAAAKIAEQEARLAQVDALARVVAADAALEEAMRKPLEGPETMIDPARLTALRETQR
jgi:CRISPR system Cascade subunit CasA